MSSYWVKTPRWLKRFYPADMVWDMPNGDAPTVYLTFDDGPHPTITPWVVETLREYGASATFFCVGNNVARYTDTYQLLLSNGHTTGNHTYNHLNGWKTNNDHYVKNIGQAALHINSRLFRPPYGRIRLSQLRKLKKTNSRWTVYMWDILSGDFDNNLTPEQCLENVLTHLAPGSIVVFHDSEKAAERMKYVLPRVLEYCSKYQWQVKALPTL